MANLTPTKRLVLDESLNGNTWNDRRLAGNGCDLAFEVEGKRFPVHSLIVRAKMMDYFDWRESYEAHANVSYKTIVLNDDINKFVTEVGLEAVIIFDYLGYFDLSSENALEVILALNYFQMKEEMKQCIDFTFAQQLLTVNNVWEFRSCFNKLDLGLGNEYSEKIDKFIKANFGLILETNGFLGISIDELETILNWNGISVANEEVIFNAAIRWIQTDVGKRRQFAERVINTVRLPQLSLDFICRVVAMNEFVKESNGLLQMLLGAIASSNRLSGFPSRSDSSRTIGPKDVYVFKSNRIGQHIMKFNFALDEWTQMNSSAELVGREWFGLAGHGQKIFVIGGEETEKCTSFDVMSGNLIEHRQMLEPRWRHCALALDNSIFAFGGFNGAWLSSMERYDIERDEWLPSNAMREKRNYPAGIILDNHIYAIGGFDGDERLSTVERFDHRVGNWEYIVPMSDRRSGAGATVLGGKIYVAGGWNGSYGSKFLNTVEIYDPRANAWSSGPSMNNARSVLGLVSDGRRLFAIGGYRGDHLNSMEIFEGSDHWTMAASMPSIAGYVKAVAM